MPKCEGVCGAHAVQAWGRLLLHTASRLCAVNAASGKLSPRTKARRRRSAWQPGIPVGAGPFIPAVRTGCNAKRGSIQTAPFARLDQGGATHPGTGTRGEQFLSPAPPAKASGPTSRHCGLAGRKTGVAVGRSRENGRHGGLCRFGPREYQSAGARSTRKYHQRKTGNRPLRRWALSCPLWSPVAVMEGSPGALSIHICMAQGKMKNAGLVGAMRKLLGHAVLRACSKHRPALRRR